MITPTTSTHLTAAADFEFNAEAVDAELKRSLETSDDARRGRVLTTQAKKLRHLADREVDRWWISRQLCG